MIPDIYGEKIYGGIVFEFLGQKLDHGKCKNINVKMY